MVASILVSIAGPSSNSPCCYYMNTCFRGQKCNYTVINQSDSSRRNSADFKFVCMQVYQTLLLLRERGSGSETSASSERWQRFLINGPAPNLNSANIFLWLVWGQTAKFKDCQYFQLYGSAFIIACMFHYVHATCDIDASS